ncbi:MAG: 50S ribosomal protein L25 [Acidobacteriota bacterium]
MSELTIEVERRETSGKNANRRLRADNKLPAVMYGLGRDPVTIEVDRPEFEALMRKAGTENAVFLLKLSGTERTRNVMVRDMQVDPIRGTTLHVDFQRVDMEAMIKVSVTIELVGTPVGVKRDGGLLEHVTHEIEVECKPDDIPPHIAVDVAELTIGHPIFAGDLTLPEGVTLQDDPQRVIASVQLRDRGTEETEEGDGLLESSSPEPERIGRTAED